MKITKADLKTAGKLISLDVTAIALTSGWTNVGLSVVQYVMPPVHGIQDVILHATAPIGPVNDMLETFQLSTPLPVSDWFQGARIRNATEDEQWVIRNPTIKKKPIGFNGFTAELAEVAGDKLLIRVRYGGGCKPHSFQLNWDGEIIKTFPPKVSFNLSHNNHGDNCMALLYETLVFDLSTLKGFPEQTTDILIEVPGTILKVRYTPVKEQALHLAEQHEIPFPTIKRGYSNKYDLAEAMQDAMAQLPDRGTNIADFLAHFSVKQIGAEVGGIACWNRLFVDVEG